MKKFYFISLSCVLFLLMSCASSQKDVQKADLHHRIGAAHLNSGNYPQALKELLLAESFDPTNPIIQNNLALAYFVRDKWEEAEKHFIKALQLKPTYTDARNNLGRLYIQTGRLDLALVELKKSIEDLTYSEPEKPLVNLGLVYLRKNEYEKSRESLLSALKVNRSFCPAHNYYGQLLLQMHEYKKATEALDVAMEFCKNLDEVHYYNALSYLKFGQKEKAVARMKEVIVLYPKSIYSQKARMVLDSEK